MTEYQINCKIYKQYNKPLTLILNQMLDAGIFHLYKKGDANTVNTYRPIPLLPAISKLFERVIYDRLYAQFDNNNILSQQQYGFRTKHSTELAAVKLVDYIKNEIDGKYTPVNNYIDISKAFDSIHFDILLH